MLHRSELLPTAAHCKRGLQPFSRRCIHLKHFRTLTGSSGRPLRGLTPVRVVCQVMPEPLTLQSEPSTRRKRTTHKLPRHEYVH
jgi:hypothetical protein